MLLRAGESRHVELSYPPLTINRPGVYDLQLVYFSRTEELIPDAKDDLRSNVFRVVIGEPPKRSFFDWVTGLVD